MPNLILPEYTGKQPLEHFINQMESLLRLSRVPFKFWTTYFKQQCQKDSRAYDALGEAETSFVATLGSDTTTTTEEQSWGREGRDTLNVEVVGMLVGYFLENPKKYPDFDFKPLKVPKLQF